MPSSKNRETEKPKVAGLVREPISEYAARRVSATEAARNFSDILNRVSYREESFLIERGGTAVAEIRPVRPRGFSSHDLVALMKTLPKVDDGFMDDLEEIHRTQPPLEDSPWED